MFVCNALASIFSPGGVVFTVIYEEKNDYLLNAFCLLKLFTRRPFYAFYLCDLVKTSLSSFKYNFDGLALPLFE